MLIIPVIDLLDDHVVHAKGGLRQTYRPVQSVLTAQSALHAVMRAYCRLFSFKTIYIADLNAIQNKGENTRQILALAGRYPEREFWLDAGLNAIKTGRFNGVKNIRLILGTENKVSEREYKQLLNDYPSLILSLDFNRSGQPEDSELYTNSSLWPERVIVMMLNRVGAGAGVAITGIRQILKRNRHSLVYAAGGVRDIEDVKQLNLIGADGVLLASALHNGAITGRALLEISDVSLYSPGHIVDSH